MAAPKIVYLDPADLVPTPDNPRVLDVSSPAMAELIKSVKADGVRVPVAARPHPKQKDKFDLRYGERRVRAAMAAGIKAVPVLLYEGLDDAAAFELTFTENYVREDLTALEEAQAVRRLLDRYKGDRSAVAAKLGQTARWVALRANVLKGLSKAWVKELGRAASDFRDWTAGHLALIARLDQFRQAEVLRQRTMYGRRDQDVTVRELDQQLNAEYVRELGKARWKLDDAELVPEAGACSECPFRTSKQELLWHDEGEDLDKADRCLNPTCWRSKEVAWAKARFAVEAEKHKATGLVLGVAQDCDYQAACNAHKQFGSEPVRLYSYVAKPCKPNAKGARPVFIAAGKGVGHVRFFAFNSDHRGRQGNKQARGADGKAKPKTLNERRADLEARRAKLVVEWFSASLCGAAAPGLEVVAVLATMFGTEHVYFHAHPPECQWKEYDKRIESGDGIAKELWHSVRGSIRAYLRVYNGAMAVERMPTVKRVGCLVATSVKVLADKAAETVPEPKAWAQLNEDGTPKKAGTKTKKAKKKGRA